MTPESFVFSPDADSHRCWPPASLTRRYHRLVAQLGLRTTLHKLRHYSATELIAAGVDLRTVAGRLGHSEGGTTLAFYAARVGEADQRASTILAKRLPQPRKTLAATPRPPQRPPSPYQVITTKLRDAIHSGHLLPGAQLPTVQRLARTHHVAPSTAHRAIAQLAHERLITTSRGRRATVTTRRS